ncbi:isomerase [Pseudoalteromonas citrea]|uniref:Isomerase n=1 Tax=Pseudoalteromonas citrea TaxID=43655 RepID=A0A5S3XNN8_9GAMM|nr:PhzF family phenazine biosynthesis protein [Pseudoalteromonas citrea]TMP43193.1 isomerase [Pseudoalteromonas citrea]TMP58719.1 isomerase [Pseudoalteromonas citrea]
MKLPLYQVDAFASNPFEGNPAAVIPLDTWLEDDLLQKIAEENNLSETAFFVQHEENFQLRWFTPMEEVDLCGHATLAAAHVLFTHLGYAKAQVCFLTRSGSLYVRRTPQGYAMDFPATEIDVIEAPEALLKGLGNCKPREVRAGFDYVVVLENEAAVKTLVPDFSAWHSLDKRGVVVTAKGDKVDFVSRCFFPKLRVNEDPVTGSAHCELAPFWARELDKTELTGLQLSARTGTVECQIVNERVVLCGQVADYLTAEISL